MCVFKCKWYDPSLRQGTRKHKDYDITEVNSSWVVVVKTKPRGHIESDDRIEGREPYQIEDPTPSKTVVDTNETISLRFAVMGDDIIDLGLDVDALPPEDDDLQEEDGINSDEEEDDEFDDNQKISSKEENGDEPEKEDDESD
ncbi:nucleoplasmin-like protein ANO39 [Arachis ipaensis]|uniref:nucleoplasmin-like protein ANO39 n=1 Tax=Arachis ipaensis TaxID=130454 RepID=UPI000A2B04D4|nr:nucleoplasmin-like protein ANO39 [Arachis ipaensis]XP_025636320.1 nucleoplasmin-like protein ANO39 [Arachis hypogaea]